MQVKKFSVWGTGILFAAVGLSIGLIMGIVSYYMLAHILPNYISSASLTSDQLAQLAQQGIDQNTLMQSMNAAYTSMGKMALWSCPLISLIVSFITGLLSALFYNLFAKISGGLKIELDK